MEGVEHGDRVLELVVDGVLVAVERVQGGDLDAVLEVVAAFLEPVAVRLPRPAGHQVQQPRPWLAVLIRREVDHPGQLLRAAAAVLDRELGHVVPHVLIHTKSLHAVAPGLVIGHRLQQRLDRGPHRVPRRPPLPRGPGDEACSRRIWLIAHQHARTVSKARGRATCSSCSVNTLSDTMVPRSARSACARSTEPADRSTARRPASSRFGRDGVPRPPRTCSPSAPEPTRRGR